jgi:hypothetical protein
MRRRVGDGGFSDLRLRDERQIHRSRIANGKRPGRCADEQKTQLHAETSNATYSRATALSLPL